MQKQTVKELKAMAKAKKIKGFSTMRKAELLAALGGSAPAPKEVKAPKKKIVKIKKAVPKTESNFVNAISPMVKEYYKKLKAAEDKDDVVLENKIVDEYRDNFNDLLYSKKLIDEYKKNIAFVRRKQNPDITFLNPKLRNQILGNQSEPAKKKIVKSKPKVEEQKKKPIMTKARLRELRKTKPKYPPPPPPSAKKKAVPAKKKIVKKAKAPVKQSGLVIDAAAQAKAEAAGKRIIIDMSGDKPVQRLVKKGKALKSRGKNFNYKGESAPEYKDLDFSNVNMFLRTGRKDYLRNML